MAEMTYQQGISTYFKEPFVNLINRRFPAPGELSSLFAQEGVKKV